MTMIVLLLSIASCKQQPVVKTPENKMDKSAEEKVLMHLKEVQWPKAYREQDTLLLDRILDDSFKMIDNDGNYYTKKDELAWIKENATVHDSFNYEIKRLDIYDNGTAVVAGTGHIYNDSTYSIYQSSNVLVKKDSLWKAILSHVSGFKTIN